MTKEQEEAISTMQHWIDYEKRNKDKIQKADELINIQETVLSMLKEKDREINRKSSTINALQCALHERMEERDRKDNIITKQKKQIDLMAECIDIELSSARLGTILNKNVKPLETYKEDIKQYFKSKAEKA